VNTGCARKKRIQASSDDERPDPEDHDPLDERPPDQELEPEEREPELELCEPL